MASLLRPIRLMLLDDHDLILHGLSRLIEGERDMEVLGCFTQSRQLIEALSEPSIDVDIVVMDYSLSPGEIDGLNLIRGLSARFPKVVLLVISALYTPVVVALALRCGAKGFLGKGICSSQLMVAVRRLALGRNYVHPEMEADLRLSKISTKPMYDSDVEIVLADDKFIDCAELSCRELEVLRCCLGGMTVTQIADKFRRSVKTISTQKRSGYRKLGLRCDNELFKVRSRIDGLV